GRASRLRRVGVARALCAIVVALRGIGTSAGALRLSTRTRLGLRGRFLDALLDLAVSSDLLVIARLVEADLLVDLAQRVRHARHTRAEVGTRAAGSSLLGADGTLAFGTQRNHGGVVPRTHDAYHLVGVLQLGLAGFE